MCRLRPLSGPNIIIPCPLFQLMGQPVNPCSRSSCPWELFYLTCQLQPSAPREFSLVRRLTAMALTLGGSKLLSPLRQWHTVLQIPWNNTLEYTSTPGNFGRTSTSSCSSPEYVPDYHHSKHHRPQAEQLVFLPP